MVLGLGTTVMMLIYTRARDPHRTVTVALSHSPLSSAPTCAQTIPHHRSDHMSQPRNGTCSQPVGELYLDNASRRKFVGLFRIAFGVFLLMLGLICGHERCRRYGQWLHNQLPTKTVRHDHYPVPPGDLLPWPCSVPSPSATQTWGYLCHRRL